MAISNSASGFRPGVCTSTTRPQAPFNGQVIYETNTGQTLVWQGTEWIMLTSAAQPPGLQLIRTQTVGTNVPGIPVSNVFSSNYDNYHIVISGMTSSIIDNAYTLQLSNSTGTTYSTFLKWTAFSNGSVNGTQTASNTAFFMPLTGNTANCNAIVDLWSPFLTRRTGMTGSGTNNGYWCSVGGEDSNAVSHTGFTIFASAGGQTLTGGTIRVYGYRN